MEDGWYWRSDIEPAADLLDRGSFVMYQCLCLTAKRFLGRGRAAALLQAHRSI